MATIKMSMDEIKKIMTPERIDRETKEALSSPPVFDHDCPPLTDEQLASLRPAVMKEV